MSRKGKGINAERDLIHKFWGNSWAAVRVAGLGLLSSRVLLQKQRGAAEAVV